MISLRIASGIKTFFPKGCLSLCQFSTFGNMATPKQHYNAYRRTLPSIQSSTCRQDRVRLHHPHHSTFQNRRDTRGRTLPIQYAGRSAGELKTLQLYNLGLEKPQ